MVFTERCSAVHETIMEHTYNPAKNISRYFVTTSRGYSMKMQNSTVSFTCTRNSFHPTTET